MILDSGNRTEFSTGAVRDVQVDSKGRCDLLPLDIVSQFLIDDVLACISSFQHTGQHFYLIRALKEFKGFDDEKTLVLEVAVHMADGAKKYGERNWQRGIPVNSYVDSAVRHYLKYLRGDTDERHDRAFCWNILCACWTCRHKPELNEYAEEAEMSKHAENKSKANTAHTG